MNILTLPMAAAIVLWAAAGTAGAANVRPYVTLNLGAVIDTDSTLTTTNLIDTMTRKPGYAATGAVGLDFGMVRAEAEIGYRTTDFDKVTEQGVGYKIDGTTQLVSYMLNGHLTVPGHATVKPFITGGIGIATAYWSDQKFQSNGIVAKIATRDTQLAWQAGIGVSYDATRNVSLDGAYRYVGTTDFDIAGFNTTYGSHNIMVGVRYRF